MFHSEVTGKVTITLSDKVIQGEVLSCDLIHNYYTQENLTADMHLTISNVQCLQVTLEKDDKETNYEIKEISW